MLDTGVITPRIYRKTLDAEVDAAPRASLHADPRAVLLRLRPRPADRGVRRADGSLRRAQGVHDDRPALPAARRAGDPRHAERVDRPGGGARSRSARAPARSVRWPPSSRTARRTSSTSLSQARRQPGSTFKTFVLTAAVEQGINPDSTYYVSAPFTYKAHPAGNCDDGTWWCVHTYANDYYGWSSIRSATIRSDNSVYAQLTLDVGPEKVAEIARRMGVRSQLDVNGAYVPSIGLGSIAVSPLDMASAYATLAARGVHSEPMAIRRVVLRGRPVDTEAGWGVPKRHRAISEGVGSDRHADPRAERPVGNRHPRRVRPAGGRQDGNDRRARRRLVRRLHARARDDRLGRLHAGRDPDAERARDRRHRRNLPGRDLAAVHGAGARGHRAAGVPRADGVAGVEAVHARSVRARV